MRGDNQQQDRFYELLEPELTRLKAFSQKLVGDREQGDDLMQDALYDAWKGFSQLREATAFKSWLYRIVINRYRANLRRFKKQAGQIVSLENDIADDSQARLSAARKRLKMAMECLSARDRALVTLHELEGWSYPELAEMFGSTAGALRTRLARCRRMMRRALLRYLERMDEDSVMTGVFKECVVVKQEKS